MFGVLAMKPCDCSSANLPTDVTEVSVRWSWVLVGLVCVGWIWGGCQCLGFGSLIGTSEMAWVPTVDNVVCGLRLAVYRGEAVLGLLWRIYGFAFASDMGLRSP